MLPQSQCFLKSPPFSAKEYFVLVQFVALPKQHGVFHVMRPENLQHTISCYLMQKHPHI